VDVCLSANCKQPTHNDCVVDISTDCLNNQCCKSTATKANREKLTKYINECKIFGILHKFCPTAIRLDGLPA